MSIEPGVVLAGRYRVERIIFRNDAVIVVAATSADQTVTTLKILPASASGPSLFSRFARAKLAESPYLPTLHELGGLEDGRPFVAMEHVEGETLTHALRHGRLPVADAVTFVAQACRAVDALHSAKVVHRRIRTTRLVKTLDAARRSEIKLLGVIAPSDVPDDVSYFAPEQALVPASGDRASDVWSLGVVLFEVLTGVLPFPGETREEILRHVLDREPTRPRAIRAELPWEIEQLILRCLQKDPKLRIESASALATALVPFSTPTPSLRPAVPLVGMFSDAIEPTAMRPRGFHRRTSGGGIEGMTADKAADYARARRLGGDAEEGAAAASASRAFSPRLLILAVVVFAVLGGIGVGLAVRSLPPSRPPASNLPPSNGAAPMPVE